MKNGTIRFIPLQSDLCLNKQKVDITDFKGWQKCNAPVYGDCLSPLYKKSDTHHDIYIGNDTYDFSQGKLYKNGLEILSGVGSKKLKKTKIQEEYSSIKLTNDNALTWCKETGSNTVTIKLGNTSQENVTINNCTRILATECFGDSEQSMWGCVVWYLHTTGASGYYVMWRRDNTTYESYGEGNPTLYTGVEVVSPLIQAAVMNDHTVIVSLFANSGTNLADVQKKNFVIRGSNAYDNPIFQDSSLYSYRYNTIAHNTDMNVNVTNKQWVDKTLGYNRVNFAFFQEIEFSWVGTTDVQSIKLSSQNGSGGEIVSETLNLTSVEKNRKWARVKIFYWGQVSSSDSSVFHHIERYGESGYELVDEGAGRYHIPGTLGEIARFYKRKNGYMPVDITYYYNTTSYPDDPTQAGSTIEEDLVAHGSTLQESDHWQICPTVFSYAINRLGYQHGDWGASSTYPEWILSTTCPTLTTKDNTAFSGTVKAYDVNGGVSIINSWKDFGGLLGYGDYADGISSSNYNWDIDYRVEVISYTKERFNTPSLKDCDCVLSDGRLYCIDALYNTEDKLPLKLFSLAGEYASFDTSTKILAYNSIATCNITYQQADNNIYPKYYAGMSISLQDKYLRILYKFKKNKETDEIIYFGVDSSSVKTEEGKNIFLYPGVQEGSDTNIQGSCVNKDGWRLLFNNNMIANIACFENENYIGTILADWLTIDTDFHTTFNATKLYYRDTNNQIWLIEKVDTGEDWQYRLIENRYIVLNTTNYFNCYDTQTGLKRHWASDYNNRVMYGYGFNQYAVNSAFSKLLTEELFRGLIITGQNAKFERTKDTITSIELGAILYERCLKDYMTFISCDTPYGAIEGIELYRGDGNSTSAAYICSFLNGLKYIDTDLTNPFAVYPISDTGNIRYNPNLFTQFITSYNNKDMVISDGIAYKLLYFNNVIPIMSYYLLDGVESLENAFVLQSSYYGVAKTRLYQMNYSNGVGVEVVADITNLEYLGALPTQALFWSAQNRAIYSFTGSCIMQLTQYANDLTNIFGKWYNPATQELFLDTNIGILVFSDLGTYCLEWAEETESRTVKDIFFFEDYFIINLMNDEEYSHYYSYNNKEGYESNKVYFITKYYGNGLVPITVNNIYVRLYDQADTNAEGFIKMKGYTITDKGTQTDTKEVLIGGTEGEEWDSETGTMLVKYTPQFNRGLGFALELETTFPIIDIKFDYVENGTIESQIAHINI